MTSLENVEMPMILQKKLTASERRVRATSLLSKMGLADRLNHLPSMLSGGEQQRVTIARALANDPELMLLDEPTGDLDTRNTEIVMNILANLNREENKTLVMVTHDVGLKNFAHRVIWMRDGKIQRIETIPEERRKTQLEELSHKLSLGKEKVKGVGQFANTELRKPSAYKPITKGNIEAPIPYRVDESVKNKVDDISILSTTSTTIVNL
jgi:putative ABC transport system ATP-binding protein